MIKKDISKGMVFSFAAVAVIVLAGCGEGVSQMKNDVTSTIEEGKQMVDNGGGFVGGLKDAMKNGVAMKCINTDIDGEWVTYTNGKKFRSEGIEAGKTQVVLVTDGVSYMWEKGAKTGQKIDMNCIKNFQKDMGIPDYEEADDMDFDYTPEELEAEEASGKLNCSPATDANFSVPTDVEFTDQCQVMKKQMEGLKTQLQSMPQ